MMKNKLSILLICFFCIFISACGKKIDSSFTPEQLFEIGSAAKDQEEYSKAIKYYIQIKEQYPFSSYAPLAELLLGDALFLQRKYDKSFIAYSEFETLYPADDNIGYVLMQLGKSALLQYRSVDRKQDDVKTALEYFQRVMNNYPDTEHAVEAKKLFRHGRNLLAQNELYLADFFWRSGQYGPSYRRYLYIIEAYPEFPEFAEYARKRSYESYLVYREELSQEGREKQIKSWKNKFDWL